MRSLPLLILLVLTAPACGPTGPDDHAALRAHHETILAAHRTGDVDRWIGLEADTVITANAGTITFPDRAARRAARAAYLERTAFTTYADLRPPIVEVSADGTLGWVLATVEVEGTTVDAEGGPRPLAAVWAWIELYRKVDGRWQLVGNLSNRRPVTG